MNMVTLQSKIRTDRADALIDQLGLECEAIEMSFKEKFSASIDTKTNIATVGVGSRELHIPPMISVYIGEIVLNLRAALDYLVYNLAIHDSHKVQERTQWPICSKQRLYKKKRETALIGISDENFKKIKRHQPFEEGAILKKLEKLSNVDKHRHLVLVLGDSVGTFTLKKVESGFETDFKVDVELCFEGESGVIPTLREIHSYITCVLEEFDCV